MGYQFLVVRRDPVSSLPRPGPAGIRPNHHAADLPGTGRARAAVPAASFLLSPASRHDASPLPARPPRPNPSATAAPANNCGAGRRQRRRNVLPAARGGSLDHRSPGAAAAHRADPARRLANQTPVRATNQKERWRS